MDMGSWTPVTMRQTKENPSTLAIEVCNSPLWKISIEALQKPAEIISFIIQMCSTARFTWRSQSGHILKLTNQCLLQHVPQLNYRNYHQHRGG